MIINLAWKQEKMAMKDVLFAMKIKRKLCCLYTYCILCCLHTK
ncbi:hypothetical protein HanXRQr2_Chr02g0065981 [Helianthus annuus]|uniref:Uncharacterized protein n=1 Tax=Helianthus annuus TaxID=4232 RepID=A0A9K3JB61_HELAN|nr:hypothetical protein HanXRQr2_Chr04g0190971 [Helianthus annuus]KAF5818498.1 hypothetical protein HanXRQr2_Chr02g0065981 [Helianthus annuus]KAJ0951828.1 hypothetical protein HanPSC8_Chr02g0064961 [Helianthus annuus]